MKNVEETKMPTVLQIEFPYSGPFGKALTEMSRELAQSNAEEPGEDEDG